MIWALRITLFVGVGVFVLYACYDNPSEKLREWRESVNCQLSQNQYCGLNPKKVLPGLAVYFVDPMLANREGRQIAVLSGHWPYCNDFTGDVYEVPQFFETDFASIPDWAQFFVKPQDPEVIGAAVIHDWLYAFGGEPISESKQRADRLFRKELENAGINIVRRNIMYLAVANFGGKSFGKQAEMRFRNLETGLPYTQSRPETPVIAKVQPGCDDFFEKYWNPEDFEFRLPGILHPAFTSVWIDLPGTHPSE